MTKTILLADDSLTIQKVVELTFADTPYNVVSVSNGDELLDKIPDIKPEIIICDIIMPGRDGYDVCQDIKSSPDTLHIPVILLSGTFEPLDRDRALAVGCSEILTKPFEARKLIDTVERLLRRRDDAEAAAAADTPQSADTGPVAVHGAGSADFGTRLSAPEPDRPAPAVEDLPAPEDEPDEGLDFTETGFVEMEAAAVSAAHLRAEAPRDGLEFEIGVGGDDADPFADLDAGDGGDADFTDAFEGEGEPFADIKDESDDVSQSDAVFDAPDRFADAAATAFEPAVETEDAAADDEQTAGEEVSEFFDEPTFQLRSAEDAFGEGSSITDADTAPLPPLDSTAGTPEEAAPAEQASFAGRLSDEDVDRIARRLLELADEKIQQIAWEVIPDVAEIVVRERIRKLEAELETEN